MSVFGVALNIAKVAAPIAASALGGPGLGAGVKAGLDLIGGSNSSAAGVGRTPPFTPPFVGTSPQFGGVLAALKDGGVLDALKDVVANKAPDKKAVEKVFDEVEDEIKRLPPSIREPIEKALKKVEEEVLAKADKGA